MNRSELIDAIVNETEVDKKTVDAVLKGFQDVVVATVAKSDDPITLTGFAKFSKSKSAARTGRNPATGETIKIKARTNPKVTPLKGFKDVVNGAAPAPKLAKPRKK